MRTKERAGEGKGNAEKVGEGRVLQLRLFPD